jgi:hypothetical protein
MCIALRRGLRPAPWGVGTHAGGDHVLPHAKWLVPTHAGALYSIRYCDIGDVARTAKGGRSSLYRTMQRFGISTRSVTDIIINN